MRINYIFILKEKSGKQVRNNIEHKEFLKEICEEIEEDYFRIKNNEYQIKYNAVYNYDDKNAFSFDIELERRNETSGKILSEVNKLITKGRHRSDYHIVTVYDEVSEYYCEKGYKISAKWERKLRELIYRIFIKAHGEQWYEEIFSKDFKDIIKERAKVQNNKLIENALQELTIHELENFLFTPYSDKSLDEVLIKGDLSKDNIYNKNKNEIIEILDRCRPKPLWERFFKGIVIKGVKKKISEIRKFRNIIAHNKGFHIEEYNEFSGMVRLMTKEIDKAIEETISTNTRSNINLEDLARAFSVVSESLSSIQKGIKKVASAEDLLRINMLDMSRRYEENRERIARSLSLILDTKK